MVTALVTSGILFCFPKKVLILALARFEFLILALFRFEIVKRYLKLILFFCYVVSELDSRVVFLGIIMTYTISV